MNVEYSVQLLLTDILQFHSDLEGSEIPVGEGVRDIALLEAAVNAPFQTFGGEDLFPELHEKAARPCYGIANNHAFIDGNKRTAVHAMEMFLLLNEKTLEEQTAVCEDVAKQMVSGACDALNVDYAISSTGIAGPGGGTKDIPVGTIWIGFGAKDDVESYLLTEDDGRDINLAKATNQALKLFLDYIKRHQTEK